MDLRAPLETPSATSALSVSFNDGCRYFTVGLNTGFCIFDSEKCHIKTSRDFNGGIGLAQMMGQANYVALVGGGRQPKFAHNKVMIWDDSKGKVALEITTLTAVRGVRLARDRVVVVLQNSVRVYPFKKPPELHAAYETADNLSGLCALGAAHLAFPGRTPGHLQVVDAASGSVSIITAHSSPLRALAMSPDGELLATASETGTLVRVFAARSGAKVAELRRGVDPATVFSLAFSPDAAMLACTSDKGTLHVFDVPHHPRRPRQVPAGAAAGASPQLGPGSAASPAAAVPEGKWGILGRIPLMPRMFSDVYSFASVPFEAGDEPLVGGLPMSESATLGTSRPAKGVIGWIGDDTLLVIGAGKDARWEKFVIFAAEDGQRLCVREGWKRYLGNT